eukprot:385894-Pelagomonas_calceolata.AAC.2
MSICPTKDCGSLDADGLGCEFTSLLLFCSDHAHPVHTLNGWLPVPESLQQGLVLYAVTSPPPRALSLGDGM